ncbi:uncharacterized protein N7503_010159 [Penicillium pulvis]|uniref:uncharacterized protein n=1 Tax=Penicillium pulvis TaxID=1562058 RepID=UPI002548CBAB|nr:uncharacterized protein N7503_010159 [Penicillium pulvis]KAJ5784947.1 hypothetical protein N7503_010159 [Penicillium pulvis]
MRCDEVQTHEIPFSSVPTKRRKRSPQTDERQTKLFQAASATATLGRVWVWVVLTRRADARSDLLRTAQGAGSSRGHGVTLLGWRQSRPLPLIASSRTRQDKLERISYPATTKRKMKEEDKILRRVEGGQRSFAPVGKEQNTKGTVSHARQFKSNVSAGVARQETSAESFLVAGLDTASNVE